jgi:hypothetical protein
MTETDYPASFKFAMQSLYRRMQGISRNIVNGVAEVSYHPRPHEIPCSAELRVLVCCAAQLNALAEELLGIRDYYEDKMCTSCVSHVLAGLPDPFDAPNEKEI